MVEPYQSIWNPGPKCRFNLESSGAAASRATPQPVAPKTAPLFPSSLISNHIVIIENRKTSANVSLTILNVLDMKGLMTSVKPFVVRPIALPGRSSESKLQFVQCQINLYQPE